MDNRLPFLFFVTLFALSCHEVHSARILSVAFVSSRSHKITYEPLLYELAARGHELTIVAPFISGKPRQNVREIVTVDFDKFMEENDVPNFFEMREKNVKLTPFLMAQVFSGVCERTYDLPEVRALLKEKFDLIIMPAIFNECTTGFVHKLNTTLMLISPMAVPGFVASQIGNPNPPSFVPNLFTGFGDSMTFFQRVVNFGVEGLVRLVWTGHLEPKMEEIYRRKLNDPNIPSSSEILKNASLILSNSHVSLMQPRPFLPDIVEVGGMHCRPAKPLPQDLGEYLNNTGSDGFIYFSMGSALKGKDMPEKSRKLFLKTFAKLKQKVLWKWETEQMDDLPKNVKLGKWFPQQDVLGHPNCKVFITHGGFGGTTEAVYHAVPLVGIPMFGDQNLNMEKNEAAGFAITIDYATLTEEKLTDALNKVINEPKYRERVRELSSLFRDQPDKPLDRAVFWTEYILRHQGATHLRSAARDLNFFQYHSLDVVAFLLVIILTALYLVFAVLRFIARKICGCGGRGSSHQGIRNGASIRKESKKRQ